MVLPPATQVLSTETGPLRDVRARIFTPPLPYMTSIIVGNPSEDAGEKAEKADPAVAVFSSFLVRVVNIIDHVAFIAFC